MCRCVLSHSPAYLRYCPCFCLNGEQSSTRPFFLPSPWLGLQAHTHNRLLRACWRLELRSPCLRGKCFADWAMSLLDMLMSVPCGRWHRIIGKSMLTSLASVPSLSKPSLWAIDFWIKVQKQLWSVTKDGNGTEGKQDLTLLWTQMLKPSCFGFF